MPLHAKLNNKIPCSWYHNLSPSSFKIQRLRSKRWDIALWDLVDKWQLCVGQCFREIRGIRCEYNYHAIAAVFERRQNVRKSPREIDICEMICVSASHTNFPASGYIWPRHDESIAGRHVCRTNDNVSRKLSLLRVRRGFTTENSTFTRVLRLIYNGHRWRCNSHPCTFTRCIVRNSLASSLPPVFFSFLLLSTLKFHVLHPCINFISISVIYYRKINYF